MLSICQWIYQTPLSIAIRESIWVYPILDVLHCVGILLVAGTIVVVDLRLLGFGMRRAPVSSVVGQVLPWTLSGFGFMFVTGSLLAWSEPVRLYHSLFFPWKLLFLAMAGLNALLFHYGIYRGVGGLGLGFAHARPRASGRRRIDRLLDLRDRGRTRCGL